MARISGFECLGNVAEAIAYADGATATATQINDGAFAILSQLNARSDSKSNPVLGAVAIFAGDAHSLSQALTSGDRAGAAGDLATLEADRGAVDSALASNPGMVSATDWNRIKAQMASLSKQLGAMPPTSRPSSGSASAAKSDSSPSTATATASAPVTSTAPSVPAATGPLMTSGSAPPSAGPALAEAPKVVIESRTIEGSTIRVKGYLEGTDLKRGGIYASSRQLTDFKLGKVAGAQRLNFDLGVESPKPDAMIRVYDAGGRMAEASIVGSGYELASSRSDSSAPADG
ncbi:MAG: hypothetical protein HY269_02395 [Deltaproteobacteria bacterium]|nr:hypothetical protein [Deltaproteobacteria bacterium]